MEFKLNLDIPKSDFQLTHQDSVVLIGSCFSDEIASHFSHSGFHTESNTFGTLFHPLAIANVLNASINKDKRVNVFKRDDLFFSWDSASKVYGLTESEIKAKMISLRENLRDKLTNAELLIVTFGTAWAYKHKALNTIVGNCHKAPALEFEKELSGNDELFEHWQNICVRLKELNPKLRIMFTVSPVRHKKDGLIENNRSKSRLIELAHALTELENVSYFPSYEIMIDELRDYRFYAEDFIHPNALAIKYIWNKFSGVYITENSLKLIEEINSIKAALTHKSLHPESKVNQDRMIEIEKRKAALLKLYPEVNF